MRCRKLLQVGEANTSYRVFSRDVCWFSSLYREVFSGYSGLPSPQKPKFDLIVLIVNLSYSTVSLISAPALEKTRHLNKVPYLFFTLPWRNDVLIKLEGLSKVYQLFGIWQRKEYLPLLILLLILAKQYIYDCRRNPGHP